MPRDPLNGYYRLNPDRLRRLYSSRGVESDNDLRSRLASTIGPATFSRILYDEVNPSARVMYAFTTFFGVKVEDIFDPVAKDIPSVRQQTPKTRATARSH